MKPNFFCLFSLLVLLSCTTLSYSSKTKKSSTVFSSEIWEYGRLDSSTSFVNNDSGYFITKTENGVIAKIRKSNNEIIKSKNYYSQSNKSKIGNTLYSFGKNIINLNFNEQVAEILTDSLELLHSFYFGEESLPENSTVKLEIQSFKAANGKYYGLLYTNYSIILFNDTEVLDELFFKENNETIIDLNLVDYKSILSQSVLPKKMELDFQVLVLKNTRKTEEIEKEKKQETLDDIKTEFKYELNTYNLKLKKESDNFIELKSSKLIPGITEKVFSMPFIVKNSSLLIKKGDYTASVATTRQVLDNLLLTLTENYIITSLKNDEKKGELVYFSVETGNEVSSLIHLKKSISISKLSESGLCLEESGIRIYFINSLGKLVEKELITFSDYKITPSNVLFRRQREIKARLVKGGEKGEKEIKDIWNLLVENNEIEQGEREENPNFSYKANFISFDLTNLIKNENQEKDKKKEDFILTNKTLYFPKEFESNFNVFSYYEGDLIIACDAGNIFFTLNEKKEKWFETESVKNIEYYNFHSINLTDDQLKQYYSHDETLDEEHKMTTIKDIYKYFLKVEKKNQQKTTEEDVLQNIDIKEPFPNVILNEMKNLYYSSRKIIKESSSAVKESLLTLDFSDSDVLSRVNSTKRDINIFIMFKNNLLHFYDIDKNQVVLEM